GPDGYAKFEARARRRRVDRRIDAARIALERRRLRDAATALDEIIELDPNLPELAELTASFDELRRDAAATRRGPWVAAAASFAVVLFGATWLQETRPLASVQTGGLSPLVETPAPAPVVQTDIVETNLADSNVPNSPNSSISVDTPVPAVPTRGRVDLAPRPVAIQAHGDPPPSPR